MGGMARMSGIPFRPKDKVPAKHGSEDESVLHENQPEPVVYDKDGIVYPTDRNYPKVEVGKPVVYPRNTPQVTNARTVSTETVAEARAAAKARKVRKA